MTDDEKAHTCSDEKNFLMVGRAMSDRRKRDKEEREKAFELLRAVREICSSLRHGESDLLIEPWFESNNFRVICGSLSEGVEVGDPVDSIIALAARLREGRKEGE